MPRWRNPVPRRPGTLLKACSRKGLWVQIPPSAFIMAVKKILTESFAHLVNSEYLEKARQGNYVPPDGKWIFYSEKSVLEKIVEKVAPLVETGQICWLKYGGRSSVIIFYSTREDRKKIREILAEKGIKGLVWKTDKTKIVTDYARENL